MIYSYLTASKGNKSFRLYQTRASMHICHKIEKLSVLYQFCASSCYAVSIKISIRTSGIDARSRDSLTRKQFIFMSETLVKWHGSGL